LTENVGEYGVAIVALWVLYSVIKELSNHKKSQPSQVSHDAVMYQQEWLQAQRQSICKIETDVSRVLETSLINSRKLDEIIRITQERS